jgi:hypothetical protein
MRPPLPDLIAVNMPSGGRRMIRRMTPLNLNKSGLAFGALLGGIHVLWALLVALGWAQPVVDFVFWMHFYKPILVVGPFSAATAAVLVAVTATIGYAAGFAFALIWNRLPR